MTTIRIHAPVPPSEPAPPLALARRDLPGSGLRLGLVDNGKPRARDLLVMLGEELARVLPLASTVLVSKPSAASPLDEDDVTGLAAQIDLAVTGLGDCGACSACSLQDALLLEAAGVPSTVLITDAFTAHVARFAGVLGAPGYHSLVVAHPVATKDDAHLRRLAESQVAPAAGQLGLDLRTPVA